MNGVLVPRGYQIEAINWLHNTKRGLLTDHPGLGKAQPIDELVLTVTGWRKIGQLEVGDSIVGVDGNDYEIEEIYYRGSLDVYRIVTNDGFEVEASGDHLWTLVEESCNNKRYGHNTKEYIATTVEVKNLFETRKRRPSRLTQLPKIACINAFLKQELYIDPYILGIILGDGCISQTSIKISSGDIEIIEDIKNRLHDSLDIVKITGSVYDYIIRNRVGTNSYENIMISDLKHYGLMGTNSETKFVPDVYKTSSTEDRILLLQGLMDSDGYISKEGVVQFSSASKKLAEDVIFLVWSIGGTARVTSKKTYYKYKGVLKVGKISYIVTICMPKNINPFRLTRKALLHKERVKYNGLRYIKHVEYVGQKECVCIKTSAEDSLYITRNFIPTHNTLESAEAAETPCLIVCPKHLIEQWGDFLKEQYADKKIVLAVGSSVERNKALNCNADFYVVNYDMIRNYKLPTEINTVIFDESHHLRNRTAQRSRAAKAIANRKPDLRVYMLSASPMWKSIEDIWMQLHILYPTIFSSYGDFVKMFCVAIATPYGPRIVSIKREMRKVLNDILEPIKMGRSYKDVGRELPPVIENVVTFNLDAPLRDVYNRIKNTYKLKWEEEGEERVMLFQGPGMIHSLRVVTACEAKYEAIKEIIEDNKKQTLVYMWYRDHAATMASHLDNCVLLTGEMDASVRRQAALRAQRQGKHIVATQASLMEGVNLQNFRQVIYGEEDYAPGSRYQSLSRVVRDRNGQSNDDPVLVYYVQAKTTIDTVIHNVAKRRKATIKDVISESLV
jgi:superfamily II DNA or RNA helicase